MPTNFHYVPLAPDALSGPAFLDQTERAINELGVEIDRANDTAQDALDTAGHALSTANDALGIAQEALVTAKDAKNTAEDAQATAKAAQTAADAAHGRADDAYDLAANAQSTGDGAQSAAQRAQETADTALTAAQKAQATADTAQTIGETAVSMATTAMGIYSYVEADTADANDYTTFPLKQYLVSDTLTNFPVTQGPVYFDVVIAQGDTDTVLSATQRVWTQDGEQCWMRTGLVEPVSDPEEEPFVTWSEWQEMVFSLDYAEMAGTVDVDGLVESANQYLLDSSSLHLPTTASGYLSVRAMDTAERVIQEFVAEDGSTTWLRTFTDAGWGEWQQLYPQPGDDTLAQQAYELAGEAMNTAQEALAAANTTLNYSSQGQPTGQRWLDGSPVYQVTIDCGALPNAATSRIPHGLTIATLIKLEGMAQTAAADSFLTLPHTGAYAAGAYNVQVDADATNIVIQTSSDLSAYTKTYVTLTYTV